MTKLEEKIPVLSSGGVEFILVGGLAAVARSSPRGTYDVDIVNRRTPGNMERLCRVVTVDTLRRLKKSTGRTKDPEARAELEEIKRRRQRRT